jgi:hypothetical protein
LEPLVWISRRDRLYVIFVSEALGGAKAALWMKDLVIKSVQYRSIGKPTQPHDVFSSLNIPPEWQQMCFELTAKVFDST